MCHLAKHVRGSILWASGWCFTLTLQIVGIYRCLPRRQGSFTTGTFGTILLANNVILMSKEVSPLIYSDDVQKCKKFSKKKVRCSSIIFCITTHLGVQSSLAYVIYASSTFEVKRIMLNMLYGGNIFVWHQNRVASLTFHRHFMIHGLQLWIITCIVSLNRTCSKLLFHLALFTLNFRMWMCLSCLQSPWRRASMATSTSRRHYILCMLFGGVEKVLPNGTRLRGSVKSLHFSYWDKICKFVTCI